MAAMTNEELARRLKAKLKSKDIVADTDVSMPVFNRLIANPSETTLTDEERMILQDVAEGRYGLDSAGTGYHLTLPRAGKPQLVAMRTPAVREMNLRHTGFNAVASAANGYKPSEDQPTVQKISEPTNTHFDIPDKFSKERRTFKEDTEAKAKGQQKRGIRDLLPKGKTIPLAKAGAQEYRP